jgi:hypothetical protein
MSTSRRYSYSGGTRGGGVPRGLMSEHGVEHDDEFAHAGGERDLGFLARREQSRVKGAQGRIAASCHQGAHIEHRTNLGTARTWARPPQIVRVPRSLPLSWLNGATPTRAAIFRRLSVPSSGRWAKRGQDKGSCDKTQQSCLPDGKNRIAAS